MNEKEFRERYAALQARTAVSPELRAKTVKHVDAARRKAVRSTRLCEKGPLPRPRSARRWALPVATCLVTAALAVGGVPLATNMWEQRTGIAADAAAEASGFAVRAYASDGSSMLEFGDDGTVVFNRIEPISGIGTDYATQGFFTGCLFRVEGEGISRVQMNVTSGKLYRYTVESFRKGDEPERMQELLTSKPLNRGMGTYYGTYDEASVLSFPARANVKDNPDAQVNVGLSKIYGSTIDISADDDPGIATGETAFGLWTNEGDPDALASAGDPFAAVIDLFEGQTLTVTVIFDDGHTSTQIIELHAADFRVDEGDPDNPNDSSLVPEAVDPSTLPEGQRALRSLYGEVIEANREAFPLPLDDANDMADTVLPAATLDRQDDTRPTNAALSTDDLRREGDVIEGNIASSDGNSKTTLSFGYPTLQRLSAPPNGKTPADFNSFVYGWFGNLAYVNKCSNEAFGYGFNDDGTLTSDEFTYVTVSFDITNTGDTDAEVWPSTIGELAVVGDDGTVSFANTSYDLDFETSENALAASDPQHVRIGAGDTVRITLLRVLSNRLADDDALVFIPGNTPISQAFTVGDQI